MSTSETFSQRRKCQQLQLLSASLCWALRGARFSPVFHFVPVKCLLIILLWAGECQASGFLNLCVWRFVLQCLLSELLWVVEISQGFFLLFSSFLIRGGSRAWCMLNKYADPELPPSPWVKTLQITLTGLELALYPDIPWVCRPLASASQGAGITWLCHQGHLFLSAVCHGRFTKFFTHFFFLVHGNSQLSKWENTQSLCIH